MAKTSSEITAAETADGHHATPRHLFHHLKQVVRADGRRVYIARDPVEADELRRKLSEHDSEAELVIHGSDEHLSALRHIHSFHQERRAAFQKQHGEHYGALETAIRDMDAVRSELHALEERVVQLDAAAEKYGFDSQVRLREPVNGSSGKPRDVEQERHDARSMMFHSKPVLRQYYHKGLLWRASESHEASSYEVFVDLVFVGVIAIAGENAAADANGRNLLRFAVTFLMGWKFWKEIGTFTALFIQEDIQRRISVLFVLVCLVGVTVNMEEFYGVTYTALVAFYMTAALMSAFSWLFYASWFPKIRLVMVTNAGLLFVSVPLWIGSIHDHSSSRYVLIWLGLFLDIVGYELKWSIGMQFRTTSNKNLSRIRTWYDKHMEYVPAMSVEHYISRFDSFVTLVLGYSVVSLLYQSATANPLNNFFTKAILALLQAFAVNSLYFEMDSFNLYTHAIRRHGWFYILLWKVAHIPFIMSFVISAAALSRLVLAHDCSHCPVDALAESYALRSQPAITMGQRWFYCAGLGIALICTAVIASTHHYRRPRGNWFIQHRKNTRLGWRAVFGVVIICLPLVGERLDSLRLIGLTTGLIHVSLFTDLLGNMLDVRISEKRRVRDEEREKRRGGEGA
jgi:low temperature requirement protein LtrA